MKQNIGDVGRRILIKLRSLLNETGNDTSEEYVMALKIENDKWKKKYIELLNHVYNNYEINKS